MFPGQSPQKAGLGEDLYRLHPQARAIFDAADDYLGFPLSRLCFEGPEDRLNEDLNCQLAIYAHSCAVTAILEAAGHSADLVSGYSSGFYAAAFAAGCFGFVEGLEIVRRAGELLLAQGALIQGGMGVIFGLDPETVGTLCRRSGQLQLAIFNTPRQIVISGRSRDVDRTLEKAMEAGALDTYRLPAAAAYHSDLMTPAGRQLRDAID
ncbi:MAG: ACP S-malonyltransferase, partial [Desulfosarcinaceae bacterium]